MYCGIRNAGKKDIVESGHVRGHQDATGRTLITIGKLNVMASKWATKAVAEARSSEPKWNEI